MAERFEIEVVYLPPDGPRRVRLSVPPGTTLRQAFERARAHGFEFDSAGGAPRCGVFGVECSPDRPVADGDRVEIYRELPSDPKSARRKRAAMKSSCG